MDQNFTDTLSQVLVGRIDDPTMIHEGGIRAVEVEGIPVDVAYHRPRFLEQTCCGGVIPKASPTLLRFGELEMTSRGTLKGMAGIDHGSAKLGGHQLLQADGMGVSLQFTQNLVTLGTVLKASIISECQLRTF